MSTKCLEVGLLFIFLLFCLMLFYIVCFLNDGWKMLTTTFAFLRVYVLYLSQIVSEDVQKMLNPVFALLHKSY